MIHIRCLLLIIKNNNNNKGNNMNIKKIGLTALAASLVSVSAYAGEMSVAGVYEIAAVKPSTIEGRV